jgi:hypothetical protein
MFDFILENWYVIIIIIALVILAIVGFIKFIKLPSSEKTSKIKALLLTWVAEAEKQYKGKTGVYKLGKVYDWFTDKFPIIKLFISFKRFQEWVDVALEKLKEDLSNETE